MSHIDKPVLDKPKKATFLQLRLQAWQGILISIGIMAVLILFVFHFNVPNPNMILIAGLVVCSALTGYTGGSIAAVIMFGYTLYFFSTGHDFLSFNETNMAKVFVSLFGILIIMVFVCELKKREQAYSREIEVLTDRLQEENLMLQEMSMMDGLTGISNRLALRNDYPTYKNQNVIVMMMDLDNFKSINDEFGHDQGDRMLSATGKMLAEQFGRRSCYRYGGDEFLVICTETTEEAFLSKLRTMIEKRPVVDEDPAKTRLDYSFGYVQGFLENDSDLRTLFSVADERMYRAKRSGHNLIVGE